MDKEALKREFIAFTSFFYLLPITLLYLKILPFGSHYYILTLMGIILIAYAMDKPIPMAELGIRKDNFRPAFIYHGVATLIIFLFLFAGWKVGLIQKLPQTETAAFYTFYILISAPLQEFIFRSLMLYELGVFFRGHKFLKIIISAAIFSFAHSFYRSWSVLLITFAMGLIWGYLYLKKPNLFAVSLSHAVLGAFTVFLGLV